MPTVTGGVSISDVNDGIQVAQTRDTVVLNADYLGVVTAGQSELVTFSIQGFSYDAVTGLDTNSFRLTVQNDGGATVVNNGDGSISITNAPTNQDTSIVTVQLEYRFNGTATFTVTRNVSITKNRLIRIAPGVFATTTQVTLLANTFGVVTVGQSEVVTFSVTGFTYDSAGEIANSGFRVSVNADGGASVTNNNDGSLAITNLPTNQERANVTITVQYRDAQGMLYSQNVDIRVSKLEPGPVSYSAAMGYVFDTDTTPDNDGEANSSSSVVSFANRDSSSLYRRDDFASLVAGDIIQIGSVSREVVSVSTATSLEYIPVTITGTFGTLTGAQNVFLSKALNGQTGATGTNGLTGTIEFSNGSTFTQSQGDCLWTPTPSANAITTDLDVSFRSGATVIAREAIRVAYLTTTGTFSTSTTTHPDGDLNTSRVSISTSTNGNAFEVVFTYQHDDGEAIATGVVSAFGAQPKIEQISVFRGPLAAAPSNPSATSINFDTGVVTGLTSGWTTAPVEVNVTDTTMLYYTATLRFVEEACGGTQTVTAIGTPQASINFGNNIQSDTFVAGSAGWQIQRDTGNAEFSNVTIRGDSQVQGDAIVDGTLTANKFDVNTVVARTVRSDNYVAPTVTQNPPNQGYSLEHVEGIGFFEEVRANVIGTLTAPSTTPSAGAYTYNTSFVTKEYLNVTAGTDWNTTFQYTRSDGSTYTFKAYVDSTPALTISLPTSPDLESGGVSSSWPAGVSITAQAAYDFYTNISDVDSWPSGFSDEGRGAIIYAAPFWTAYNSAGTLIGSSYIELQDLSSFTPSINSGSFSFAPTIARTIQSSTDADTIDLVGSFSTAAVRNQVWVGAEIPTEARLFFGIFSNRPLEYEGVSSRPSPTVPISITAGIRANSSVSFVVGTDDGSTDTQTVTQG